MENSLNESNRERIRQCELRQEHLRRLAQNKRRFTDAERNALGIKTQEAFNAFWEDMLTTKAGFDQTHEKGIGRITKSATNFAASAHSIVRNFNPLVELVSDFGAPCGSMALGTICFVLVVAKNRTESENQITATLLDIQNRLPGFQMYQHIQTENTGLDCHLQSKIIDAYQSFIDFCMEASVFYSQKGAVRWLKAIGGPSKLDSAARAVRKALVDVRQVCEELVDQNMHQLKAQNQGKSLPTLPNIRANTLDAKQVGTELMKILEELTGTINELQEGKCSERLSRLRTALKMNPRRLNDQEEQLALRKYGVEDEYGDTSAFEHVEADPKFRQWLDSAGSQVFVLNGINADDRATHCWLSPVALKLIADKSSLEKTQGATDICISHILNLRVEDNSFDHVIRSLIDRILLKNKHRLGRREVEAVDREVEEYSSLAANPEAEMYQVQDALTKILVQSLALFDPKTTVWMILDRAEQCYLPRAQITPGRINQQRKALVKALVHTAERTGLVLKVLLVVNNAEWKVEKHADDLGQKKSDSLVIGTFEESN
ncbi:uncharacterized protein PG998_004455 [Apiospora kogelbergensis]|uniref:uncharacterized protein n=1 Tax=Apiospora kogelbergensis TaxID=1337665 RepID=UPI0031308664